MELTQLSPRRPYLLRAFYEWLIDNKLTPHLVVDISVNGIIAPIDFARNDRIVFNIAPIAVAYLVLGKDLVQFSACFKGIQRQILLPVAAIIAIYASENGVGMIFDQESAYDQLVSVSKVCDAKTKLTKTIMSVITSNKIDHIKNDRHEDDKPPTPKCRLRPSLRVVK